MARKSWIGAIHKTYDEDKIDGDDICYIAIV